VLQTLRDRPEEVEAGREKLAGLVEEQLWPASGLSRTQAIYLEIFGWRRPAPENYLTSEPMVFVSPAGAEEQLR
jgi:hypothetical protein